MIQALEVLGSLLILAPFGAAQRGRLSTQSTLYLALNLTGSAILTGTALIEMQVGFVILEACWAVVTAIGLINACSVLKRPRDPTS